MILFSVAGIGALALQTGGLHWLPLGSLIPDLILILAVNLGLKHHSALAAILSFAMGYATDVFSGSQIGLNAFMITLIFLLSYEISRSLMVSSDLGGSIIVFLGVLLKTFGVFTLNGSFAGMVRADATMIRMALVQAGLTAIVAPFVFAGLASGKKILGLPDRQVQD